MKSSIKNIVSLSLFYPLIKFKEFSDRMYGFTILSKVKNKGENCVFEGYGRIHEIDRLEIGNHEFLGRIFFLRCAGTVKIGDYTHISRNVTIHTVNYNIAGQYLPYDKMNIEKSIRIGNYVWIGMNVSVLSGVSIGDGAVIGMGSVISKDVLPGEIVVGSAQRVIGIRDSKHTSDLVNKGMFLKK